MKKVLLGVTSSVSAYKACEIVRLLKKRGYGVKVIMSENSTKFVSPLLFESLSQEKVIVDQFKDPEHTKIEHINVAREYDLFLIAPASLNTIGKLANGIADNFLTLVFFAFRNKVVLAPAMNNYMYEHPIHVENLKKLKKIGVEIIEPDSGSLACGEEGKGRLPEPEVIVDKVIMELSDNLFRGEKFVVTGGATREWIDNFRFISNPSSGKMGYWLAKKARDFGANVLYVRAKTSLKEPNFVESVEFETTDELYSILKEKIKGTKVLIMASAVSDFRSEKKYRGKIKKSDKESLTIKLTKTIDILKSLSKEKGDKYFIGFSAEMGFNVKEAKRKLKDKNLDLVVLNSISHPDSGFVSDKNKVKLIFKDGETVESDLLHKSEIAEIILREIHKKWFQ